MKSINPSPHNIIHRRQSRLEFITLYCRQIIRRGVIILFGTLNCLCVVSLRPGRFLPVKGPLRRHCNVAGLASEDCCSQELACSSPAACGVVINKLQRR
jgi:hypothetical protein